MENSMYVPIHNYKEGLINTNSGQQINLLQPDPETLLLEDIAIGLSHTCRFGGQIPVFYSVAKHSMLVAALAPPKFRLEALMHDAPEAYIQDIVKPLKHLLSPLYDKIEKRFTLAMCYKFKMRISVLENDIKRYDMQALVIENDAFRFDKLDGLRDALGGNAQMVKFLSMDAVDTYAEFYHAVLHELTLEGWNATFNLNRNQF
jgi:hypothetical protein